MPSATWSLFMAVAGPQTVMGQHRLRSRGLVSALWCMKRWSLGSGYWLAGSHHGARQKQVAWHAGLRGNLRLSTETLHREVSGPGGDDEDVTIVLAGCKARSWPWNIKASWHVWLLSQHLETCPGDGVTRHWKMCVLSKISLSVVSGLQVFVNFLPCPQSIANSINFKGVLLLPGA